MHITILCKLANLYLLCIYVLVNRMLLHVCVFVYACAHVYDCMHVCEWVSEWSWVNECIHGWVSEEMCGCLTTMWHVHECLCGHACLCSVCVSIAMHTCICVFVCVRLCACMHMYVWHQLATSTLLKMRCSITPYKRSLAYTQLLVTP